jgi:hypothetical protein
VHFSKLYEALRLAMLHLHRCDAVSKCVSITYRTRPSSSTYKLIEISIPEGRQRLISSSLVLELSSSRLRYGALVQPGYDLWLGIASTTLLSDILCEDTQIIPGLGL